MGSFTGGGSGSGVELALEHEEGEMSEVVAKEDESVCIRESVDSLCRNGTDTPYAQYKIKLSKFLQKITSKLL